jgi:DNA mismatch repair protein MSH6
MGCMFKPKSSDHGDSGEKELTFLYRLMSGACPESYGLQVATMAGLPKSIVEKASVTGEMTRSKIARNFKSSEERVEFSTLHEEWFMAAIYVCGVEGQLDDDTMDPAFCISQELKAHFKKAG